jgi:hypothetical protein
LVSYAKALGALGWVRALDELFLQDILFSQRLQSLLAYVLRSLLCFLQPPASTCQAQKLMGFLGYNDRFHLTAFFCLNYVSL